MTPIADQLQALPPAHYGCLLADPPWSFETYGGWKVPQRAPVQHYDTMKEAELKALPVARIAAKDAVLQMWILDTHLEQALRVGAAWGFTYKTVGLVWQKMSPGGLNYIGLGHWYRSGGEISLLFTKGKPKRLDRGVRQFIHSPVREHSRKPEDQFRRLEALCAGPRLELFGRQQRAGWDVVGNEVDKFTRAG